LRRLGVELVRGDVTEPASLPGAVEGCEAVVHLAGLVKALGRAEYFRVNVEGTRSLALACIAARPRPRLLLVSSLAAAGPAGPRRPRAEAEPPAPVSSYGESKLAAEQVLQELSGRLDSTVVRPPLVYGPHDKELLPQLFRMARLGFIFKAGFGEKRYSLIHVEDLCRGILAGVERGKCLRRSGSEGTYFLSDGAEHTWEAIGQAAAEALGVAARVLPVPETASYLVAAGSALLSGLTRRPAMLSFDKMNEIRQAAWTCSIDKAVAEMGFAPRFALAEGMRQSVDWYRARGLAGC
jgi:dihydroflavonol-4-reductase